MNGATGIIAAAVKEPSIKSFVYTSSSTAVLMPQPDTKAVVTKVTWDQAILDKIQNESKPAAFDFHGTSKTGAKKLIWSALEKHKPEAQVATVLPNVNLGAIIYSQGEEHSSTASWVVKLVRGDASILEVMAVQWFVNVQDTTRLHVSVLLDPDCNNERIFAFAATSNGNDVLAALRTFYPNHKFLDDVPDQVGGFVKAGLATGESVKAVDGI
ncbi:hypothetical protein LTR56_008218 [Elasticomyces elasticus]|nr:hypothetical protein LTR56_008218 [Elasticomyces elasticus]KAK3661783.1 hypothetical protein LTR22_007364 [Elasticomyces elasticus]KAK4924388.1 hypothetical protein LTR49_008477 [Elasticomyces elasticus]KAK5762648.1 hypothetical protein LTS12_007240 [Elasticomyces elasticus]